MILVILTWVRKEQFLSKRHGRHGGAVLQLPMTSLVTSSVAWILPSYLAGGKVVAFKVDGKVTGCDLDDHHTAKVVEGVVLAFPVDRDPSAYLLGDSLLHLNTMMGDVIFGPCRPNPMDEKSRRDTILKEGTKLKQLLSYVRAATGRTERGRSPTMTFLKELVLSRGRPSKRSQSKSPASSCSTMSAKTLILGEESSASSSRTSRATGADAEMVQPRIPSSIHSVGQTQTEFQCSIPKATTKEPNICTISISLTCDKIFG